MPPSTDGVWTGATAFNIAPTTIDDGFGVTMPDTRGLFVLHAVLLHTGKVLCFSGHVEGVMYAPLYYLFDPKAPAALMAPIAFPGNPDMFCCHYVQLKDGNVLAAGGSEHDMTDPMTGDVIYQGSRGSKTIAIFDPTASAGAGSWSLARTGGVTHELAQGRWYPTLVLLPDGRVAVFSGRRENGVPYPPAIADEVEILKPDENYKATTLTSTPGATPLPIYPGLHLAKDGKIYFTHTCWGQEIADPDTFVIEITSTEAKFTGLGIRPASPRREEGMSVPLPPVQDGKILLVGGSRALKSGGAGVFDLPAPIGPPTFDHIQAAADGLAADILDTSTSPPTWTAAGPMAFPRINGHCVLLPDETVLICGGHDNYKWLARPTTQPSLDAEIYKPNPPGAGFRTVAAMNDPRMYHSVALLLPDGRVFTAGGADANSSEPTLVYPGGWNPRRRYGVGTALNSKTFELYEPPYMHNGTRPDLTDVTRNGTSTRRVEYGQSFKALSPQASSIDKVAFMRPGACTHHTDTEQRYVRLEFTKTMSELTVTAPADAKLAPPGYYMLWIVDSAGLPCKEAIFVQLVPKGSSCAVATACFESPFHPRVEYLKAIRREVREGSAAGRWFMDTANRIYESFSYSAAAQLSRDEAAREVVRDTIVRPAIALIAVCDRLVPRIPRLRQPLLVALLATALAAWLAALPAVGLIAKARLALRRRRANTDRAPDARSNE